jgi:hypothetical protein
MSNLYNIRWYYNSMKITPKKCKPPIRILYKKGVIRLIDTHETTPLKPKERIL